MWSPGRTVDRYVLEAPVADDPTGAWWRVRHRMLGSLHLLRLSPPEAPRDELMRIAQLQAKLHHPQLLSATDCFEHEGKVCVVTDLVELQSLADRLRQGPLVPPEAHKVLRGLVAAVGAMHTLGFLHLDLQPSRILWCAGVPRIADFRLTRAMGEPGFRGGNPAYMAPELLASAPPDARSDIYALGCVAYELLKGTALFSGDADRRSPPLSDLPPSWIALLDRCLRAEPGGRYPHAGALLRAMDEGEPRKGEGEPRKVETEPRKVEAEQVPAAPQPVPPPETSRPTPTLVTVEEEPPPRPRPIPREPDVSTRWGTVLGLGLLIGLMGIVCIGVLGGSWWYYGRTEPKTSAVAPLKMPVDTGTPPVTGRPDGAVRPEISAPLRRAEPVPIPTKTATRGAPVDAPVDAPEPTIAATVSTDPAAPVTSPEPALPAASGLTIVTFTGETVPSTIEVTCRGGFRTRVKVSGKQVEVAGLPSEGECFMYLKDVVATPAPIRANRHYNCEVVGTTTKCR